MLLEPGRCVPSSLYGLVPSHVPAEPDEKPLLGTPYGLLLSECAHSPHLVPTFTLSLVKQARLQMSRDDHTLS